SVWCHRTTRKHQIPLLDLEDQSRLLAPLDLPDPSHQSHPVGRLGPADLAVLVDQLLQLHPLLQEVPWVLLDQLLPLRRAVQLHLADQVCPSDLPDPSHRHPPAHQLGQLPPVHLAFLVVLDPQVDQKDQQGAPTRDFRRCSATTQGTN
ncbi:MAG: hypothetical protein RLZZ254_985, partial [Actinomycetota bacterium]